MLSQVLTIIQSFSTPLEGVPNYYIYFSLPFSFINEPFMLNIFQ